MLVLGRVSVSAVLQSVLLPAEQICVSDELLKYAKYLSLE